MINPAQFRDVCEQICDRLKRDTNDREAFELMHSGDFMLSCAWLGLDPAETEGNLQRIAAIRRAMKSAA